MKCVVLVLALFACLTSLPACAAGDDAKQLYEKAVSAFEKDDYLKALDLVGQAIKLSPANRQAQKLKLVIEETLKGEVGAVDGSTGPSNSRWTFCFGQNTIESEPSFVHVYHTADGLVNAPSYATMALQLSSRSTRCCSVSSLASRAICLPA